MIYVGIDPGVRMCGVAIERDNPKFDRRTAFIVKSAHTELHLRAAEMARVIAQQLDSNDRLELCVEGQQVYRSEKAKGDPNDILKLATVAGVLVGVLYDKFALEFNGTWHGVPDIAMPLPRKWKGTVPKAIHQTRLAGTYPYWKKFVESDTPKSMQHHVWDAVGLLEWNKERLEK